MCIESIIITTYGSIIKNKFLHSRIFFDEELEKGLIYPYNEGIFTNCLDNNGNYLKNIILLYNKINPGIYINVKIIGGYTYNLNGNIIDNIISVKCSTDQPDTIFDLNSYKLEEIKSFVINYHKSKNERIEFNGFIDMRDANDLYKDSKIRKYRFLNENKENLEKIEQKCNI